MSEALEERVQALEVELGAAAEAFNDLKGTETVTVDQPDQRCFLVTDLREGETANLHGKAYPLVGARLRLLRETYGPRAGIATRVRRDISPEDGWCVEATLSIDGQVVAQAHATADMGSDKRLGDSLIELAETRAIARCLRFGGFAVDATGAEEVQGKPPLGSRSSKGGGQRGSGAGGATVHATYTPNFELSQLQRTQLQDRGWTWDDDAGVFEAQFTPAQATQEKNNIESLDLGEVVIEER